MARNAPNIDLVPLSLEVARACVACQDPDDFVALGRILGSVADRLHVEAARRRDRGDPIRAANRKRSDLAGGPRRSAGGIRRG